MMVAWHEMPGEYTDMTPPVGNGVIRDTQTLSTFQDNRTPSPTNHTVPYGTISQCDVSRHFMPGFHHVVPPGRNDVPSRSRLSRRSFNVNPGGRR